MAIDFEKKLLRKTKYIDSRIKETDLYGLCSDIYVNQKYNNCECIVSVPNLIKFNYHNFINAGLGIRHEILCKSVIQMYGDYCLTYSEERQFDTKNNLVNLDIKIEFLLGEIIRIVAFRKSYGTLFKMRHFKASKINDSYVPYASIPTVGIEDFNLIPFGEIFAGCYPETVQMFEDYYSGNIYPKKVLKK